MWGYLALVTGLAAWEAAAAAAHGSIHIHQRDTALGDSQPGVLEGDGSHGLGMPAEHRGSWAAAGRAQVICTDLASC